jgi:hypothetical protein
MAEAQQLQTLTTEYQNIQQGELHNSQPITLCYANVIE